MSYTVVEGRYWSAVGKSFGEILSISPSGSDDVLVTMTSPSKIRLQRRLLFAPIPRICLEGEIVIRGLRSLQELWLTMPLEVRLAREIAVEKFSGLSPEEVRRATMLHLEHSAYDDLRSRDATTSEEQRPSEPDPIYKVVAALVVANWETPRSRAPRPRPIEATTEGALQSTAAEGVIKRSVRRRVATGLRSTSSEHTHSGPPPTLAGPTPGGSVVVKAPLVTPPSRSTVALTGTSIGAYHAESSRTRALRSSSAQSPTAHADVGRATVPRRTSAHAIRGASTGQGPQTSGRIERGESTSGRRRRRRDRRRTRPYTEYASQVEGRIEEEAKDIDQPSDEEEDMGTGRRRAPRATQVKFSTEEEFQKGYIWRPSFQFDAAFNNIRLVQHMETNHRCLSQRRMKDIYKRLGGPDASLVSPLTL
jgi:hypothetical protein